MTLSSPSGTSKSSSSWICRMSLLLRPSSRMRSSTAIIASLMMSAALPCMGWFMAVRSPKLRMLALRARMSGTWRLRPYIVCTQTLRLAMATVPSR